MLGFWRSLRVGNFGALFGYSCIVGAKVAEETPGCARVYSEGIDKISWTRNAVGVVALTVGDTQHPAEKIEGIFVAKPAREPAEALGVLWPEYHDVRRVATLQLCCLDYASRTVKQEERYVDQLERTGCTRSGVEVPQLGSSF